MDEHLKELVENTPSSQAKLLAAWDGLSVETQIKLLHAVADGGRLHLLFHRDIIARALKSPNEYIRYLAARSRDLDKDPEIVNQLAADENPLVQYAQDELRAYLPGTMGPAYIPVEFWGFPKAKQLAIARAESPPYCCDFAEFLMRAIETRGATDDELSDVVFEYVKNPEVKKREYQHEDLWKILPKMPEGVAWKFVAYLSAECDHSAVIPPAVLDWLCGDMLTRLLC